MQQKDQAALDYKGCPLLFELELFPLRWNPYASYNC